MSTRVSICVGIDFGTTYSTVSYEKDGEVIILNNLQDRNATPSFICFQDNNRLFGEEAQAKS